MKMIRRSGSVRTRTVPRGHPIGYPKAGGGPLPPGKYFLFNGVNQSVSFNEWIPSTPDFTVTCYIRYVGIGGAGTSNHIVGNTTYTSGIFLNTSVLQFRFRSPTAGGQVNVSSGNAVANVTVQAIANSYGVGGSDFITTGAPLASQSDETLPIGFGYNAIASRGATTEFYGFIAGVALTDNAAPNNSRWYPINDGTGSTVKCYEGDQVTPAPANDGLINNYTDNWQPIDAVPAFTHPPVWDEIPTQLPVLPPPE